ncbi:MAG: right-handed parallel beta-helix repeat-containing protein [Planctomycetota bacterium]
MRRTLAVVPFLVAALPAQLAGPYTINPTWPSSASNFASLLDATTALATQGVAGPVEFWIYDDAGPFTEATPFVTNVAYAPNTAVLVLTQWTGSSAANRVTFRSAPGERAVFDAAGRAMGVFWGGADYVTLQGIEVKNATFDAISLFAEASHGIVQDAIIDRCQLHDCGGTGVTIYGNTPQPANTLVQNCLLWRLQLTNAGTFNTTARFGYITTRRSNGTRIVHNTFVADTGVGSMFCVLGAYPSGTAEVPYAEVSNNIVVKTANAAAPFLRMQSPAGTLYPVPVVCESNCWHDTSGGPFALWGTSATTTSATLLDWQLTAFRDLASIQGPPQFVDGANRDYHLLATSPCLGASTVAASVADDLDQQPRTTAIDIGADEFSAATSTPVGASCVGTGGLGPFLRTNVPFLGNPAFAGYLANVPPGLLVVLFGSVGLSPVPIPFGAGCTVYLDPPTLTSLAVALAGPVGTTSFVYALPANPAFVGVQLGWQSLVLDAGAPLGFTLTNGVDLLFAF